MFTISATSVTIVNALYPMRKVLYDNAWKLMARPGFTSRLLGSFAARFPGEVLAATFVVAILLFGQGKSAESKPMRLSIASAFHPIDSLFGDQLGKFFAIVKNDSDGNIRLRRSRKTLLASPGQIVAQLGVGGVDGVLLDPIALGYRPAIALIFGGLPFGPTAAQIIDWANSSVGRETIGQDFSPIGMHPLICGHSDIASGVFARDLFVWPIEPQSLAVYTAGPAAQILKALKMRVQPLHVADLYLGYATGVVDLLVTLNPAMGARAGFAQFSRYFYYPSWERRSAFALLLMDRDKWLAMSATNRQVFERACNKLNMKPHPIDMTGVLETILKQGADDTIIRPWPAGYLAAAKQQWAISAKRIAEQHPSLAIAFRSLNVPGNDPRN